MTTMTTPAEDPTAFIEAQGWTFRHAGSQYLLDCPLCGKSGKFYMNQSSGLWDCKVCGERGNLYQLRERLGLRRGSIVSLREAVQAPRRRIPMAQIEAMHRT